MKQGHKMMLFNHRLIVAPTIATRRQFGCVADGIRFVFVLLAGRADSLVL